MLSRPHRGSAVPPCSLAPRPGARRRPPSAASPPPRSATRARVGGEVPGHPESRTRCGPTCASSSARPHHLGSPRDSANAAWILERFRGLGPRRADRDLPRAVPHPAGAAWWSWSRRQRFARQAARSRRVKQDPTSSQQAEQLPTYNAYSPDGDVTAPLVFVNYGVPEDYDAARAPRRLGQGRDRHRAGTAGRGAASSPRWPRSTARSAASSTRTRADDGYHAGDTYPAGPFRPQEGVQRGSVMDMPLFAGRPADARGRRDEGRQAARPRRGADAPEDSGPAALLGRCAAAARRHRRPARAGRVGRRPADHLSRRARAPREVQLKLRFDWRLVPAYDVIARIPGATRPDEWVVRGNHHDAWVNGAEDPISGAVALLEEARAYGALLKQGWRPRRTIVLALWDGEEPMLLGSHRMGGDPRRRAAPRGGRLPQHRRQRARPARRRADRRPRRA